MADGSRFEPRLYPDGVRPVGNTVPGVSFDVKCACGITAIVSTMAWGFQCQPCYDADVRRLTERHRAEILNAFEIPQPLRNAWRQIHEEHR
jgi:hypothetical protein